MWFQVTEYDNAFLEILDSIIYIYIYIHIHTHITSPVAQTVKNLPAMQKVQVQSLGWKIPWRRKWLPSPAFLPGEFYGQRSLLGYSL